MDDFICWSDDKDVLHELGRDIKLLVSNSLGLDLKHQPCPQPTKQGMNFLGYRIYPDHVRLARRSKTRYIRRLRLLARLAHDGTLDEAEVQTRLTAATAFLLPARSCGFRRRAMAQVRSAVIGHEPGEPGRQLEQQREQLPRREPQQQQPDKHEQQHRVPGGPQLRPPGLDDSSLSEGLNRPPSCSSGAYPGDETQDRPPGAGMPAEAGSKAPGGGTTATH